MNGKEHKFVCTNFLSSGICLYDKSCKFSHPNFLASNNTTKKKFEESVQEICYEKKIKKTTFISKNQFPRDNTDILFWEYDKNGDDQNYRPGNKLYSGESQIWIHFNYFLEKKKFVPDPKINSNLVGKERLPVFKCLSKGDTV